MLATAFVCVSHALVGCASTDHPDHGAAGAKQNITNEHPGTFFQRNLFIILGDFNFIIRIIRGLISNCINLRHVRMNVHVQSCIRSSMYVRPLQEGDDGYHFWAEVRLESCTVLYFEGSAAVSCTLLCLLHLELDMIARVLTLLVRSIAALSLQELSAQVSCRQ